MEREIPKPGEFYRHFKNKDYEIVTVALHSETEEPLVIYRALYGDFGDYARPLAMFMSEVDREKYPEATQTYRFEKIGERTAAGRAPSEEAVTREKKETARGRERLQVRETSGDGWRSGFDRKGRTIIIEEADERKTDPELLNLFLGADSFDEKIDILRGNRDKVTNRLIDDIGVVMDLPIKEGGKEERLQELMGCLRTMSKFDGRRLR
ncbi:MAG: DUF1653 domain-containing protein [Lachnospiraceae bacterium]|nr:DUF1653 domain-containing protein [Lachnospiraceae bacterium]